MFLVSFGSYLFSICSKPLKGHASKLRGIGEIREGRASWPLPSEWETLSFQKLKSDLG